MKLIGLVLMVQRSKKFNYVKMDMIAMDERVKFLNKYLVILFITILMLTFSGCDSNRVNNINSEDQATETEVIHINSEDQAIVIDKFKNGQVATSVPDLLYADDRDVVICWGKALIVFDRKDKKITRAIDIGEFGYTHMEGDADGAFGVDASRDGNTFYFTPFDASKQGKHGIYERDNDVFYYCDFGIGELDLFDKYIDTEVLLDAGIFKSKSNAEDWYSDYSILLEPDTFLGFVIEEPKMSTLKIITRERGMKQKSINVFPK